MCYVCNVRNTAAIVEHMKYLLDIVRSILFEINWSSDLQIGLAI